MIKKKFLLVALMIATAFIAEAQVSSTGGYDWRDSSLVPPSRMEQHYEFMNNQYNFPAKPRSQWELGVKVGAPIVNGDVDPSFPGIGFGLHARKSLGYLVSLRGDYTFGIARGVGPRYITVPALLNPAWAAYPAGKLYYNYKTTVNELSLNTILSLNNISFHRAEPKVLLYGLAGVGFMFYNTKVDALNGSAPYNFAAGMTNANVKAMLDGTYETNAATTGSKLKPIANFGFGASFKISNKVNVSFEDRVSVLNDDLLDGVKYYYPVAGTPVVSNRNDLYNFLSFGINVNLF